MKSHKYIFSLFHILVVLFNTNAQSMGKMAGFVRDARTQEALIGVSIKLDGTNIGAVTNENGYYTINNIPTQSYNITASYIGYQSLTKYDVVVTSGNTLNLNFAIEEANTDLTEVEIKASPFLKNSETPNSIQSLSAQEIQSYPGGNNDVAKVVQSLPGVSGSVGFRNDLIIRGGAPNENVYYLDGIEIPNINHFSTQGSAGGPVGMLNVSFVEDVTLTTSGFNARYDNPLSGVLQFKQRTGNQERTQGNVRLGASEAALTLEGPLGKNGRTTYIVSARRSYLQFLFKAIGLPFLPDYWDYQYKISHKLTAKDEISVVGLGSIDNFEFNPPEYRANFTDEERKDYFENLAILDRIPLLTQRSSTGGLTWKHLQEGGKGFFTLTASTNFLDNRAEKYDNNDPSQTLRQKLKSTETENKLRFEHTLFHDKWTFSYGATLQRAHYANATYLLLRRAATDENGNPIAADFIDYNNTLTFAKYGVFGQVSRNFLSDKLKLSAGLRSDGNTYTTDGNNLSKTISPRLAACYALAKNLNINTSVGRYYKLAPYTVLGFEDNTGTRVNKNAGYISSNHAVLGLEYLPTPSTRITLEGFYKYYNRYPVSVHDSVSLANLGGDFGTLGNEATAPVGKMRTYGFEFLLQQKLTKNFYGILAYTYYFSEATAYGNTYKPTAWDNRHLLSFTGGYKLPRNWELGLRFRFLGKAPYSPTDTTASLAQYSATGQAVLDYSRVNSLRVASAYRTLDIRVDKKWNFKRWSLDIYAEVQNVLNTKNYSDPSFTLQRNPDGTIRTKNGQPYSPSQPFNAYATFIENTSGSRLPSIGMIVQF
ncbi:Outer membrane receptor proteins, mostly Fe transport [Flexibacter flexilis DSM 6793]|uniref:Outer membrane receptor proteins, mostly Fe transport n=2 Tax=Flexibacter flexilis TaxID=998 RepID=A0A1I1FKE5_9BACT|nr:Outer membrane receptor proteins, mostly Fe transport [Flexibacter flexilis DSM 6793]